MKTAVVTGSSSGIGYEICKIFLLKGYNVIGISRRGEGPDGITALRADVSDSVSVASVFSEISDLTDSLDIFINVAGMGISGPIEFTEEKDARYIMDVNFFGQFFCAKQAVGIMRKQGFGTIVFVSSVAAPIAIPYQAFYSTSKAAVNALALSLRNEVKAFGIKVCAVMPGDASTGFTSARQKQLNGSDIYTHCSDSIAAMEKDETNGMSAHDVAQVIVNAAEKKNPKPLYIAGEKYKLLYFLFKIFPARFAYWIVGKMY